MTFPDLGETAIIGPSFVAEYFCRPSRRLTLQLVLDGLPAIHLDVMNLICSVGVARGCFGMLVLIVTVDCVIHVTKVPSNEAGRYGDRNMYRCGIVDKFRDEGILYILANGHLTVARSWDRAGVIKARDKI
jgi:hypothetical protein